MSLILVNSYKVIAVSSGPVVTSYTPHYGNPSGPEIVLTGTGFTDDGFGVANIQVGSSWNSNKAICAYLTATTVSCGLEPDADEGVYNLLIYDAAGVALLQTFPYGFVYTTEDHAPTVASIDVGTGSTAGGQVRFVTGQDFPIASGIGDAGGAGIGQGDCTRCYIKNTVSLTEYECTDVGISDAQTLAMVTPAAPAGTYKVRVTSVLGTGLSTTGLLVLT